MANDLVIGMAGSGGDGIVSAGESLVSAAAFEGYCAVMTKSFGSQIRGGESSCRVRISTNKVLNPGGALDVAVALNWEDFLRFGAELPIDGDTVVIYESRTGVATDALPLPGVKPAEAFAVPITDMAKQGAGSDKAKNTVVLGLIAGWFDVARESILRGIRKKFGKKGPELVEANEKAFALGEQYAREHPLKRPRTMDRIANPEPRLLTDGNDIAAAAAIFAGCDFFSGYPITPSTEVMQFFNREVWKYGGSVVQCEDEIAGIGAAFGASFGGHKALTATSGPGLSLKAEIMGLASIAELPLVIIDVQRGGPSTGLPTKPEQADLFCAAFSAHGDVVRPVLASTDVADTFGTVVEAFNIAERYQTPVIVLTDQEIGQRKEAFPPIDTSKFKIEERLRPAGAELDGYMRFKNTPTGISPVSHPGMLGGNYLGSGIEHNEKGDPTASGGIHQKMNEKRFRKLEPLRHRTDLFEHIGDPKAQIGVISWGSTAGVCREAVMKANAKGLHVKLLIPYLLYPINEEVYRDFFASLKAGLAVELSYQCQIYRLLRMFVDVPAGFVPMARSGANPFAPDEVTARLRELAFGLQHDPKSDHGTSED
jgi:2-oxoglutarate ferredoxin oxidoreductase subunit alpha